MFFFGDIEKYGAATAVITKDGREISYLRLSEIAQNMTADMRSRSLAFLVASNTLPSLAAYVGFMKKGIVPIMLNQDINEGMLQNLLAVYRPEYIVAPKNITEAATVKSTDISDGYSWGETFFEDSPALNPELALLLTTSGSTGSPKLVRQSYANIISNTNAIIEYLKIKSDDIAITTMPMNYTYGLSIINSHLIAGATVVLCDAPLMSKDFWTLLKRHKVTTFGGVPYIYEMLKKLRFSRMELPYLKYITQAGGKLSAQLQNEFVSIAKEKGFEFIVMYGQTEATARMSYLPWEYAESKSGSMGIAIPGGKFTLIDMNGNVITANDEVGELVYEGDNVTLGYAESKEDLSKGDEFRSRLETGDMAKRDGDGFYYIVGRKKRFLKLFGKRVNLDEIESLLRTSGYDCAVGGKDDSMVIYTSHKDKANEIRDMISDKTGINFIAFKIMVLDEIPRNSNGKIAYAKLADTEV